MKKHLMSSLVILFCIITGFLGCAYTIYENITFIERDNKQYVSYNGNEYYPSSLFEATEYYGAINENDVELGYYYSFPFSTKFYSDTRDTPLYIYSIGGDTSLYLKQGYDYKSEEFIVGDTSETIVFSEALIQSDIEYNSLQTIENSTELEMYLKDNPKLKISLTLFCENNVWHAGIRSDESYLVSDLFLNLLYESKIIQSPNEKTT